MAERNAERRIVIGLITSTDFIHQIRDIYNPRFLEASMAKRLATWCIDYYDKYGQAPKEHLSDIYFTKLKKGLSKEIAEEIEQDILPSLNEEFLQEGVNVTFLVDLAKNYFSEKSLELLNKQVEALLEEGKLEEANQLVNSFHPFTQEKEEHINFSEKESLKRLRKAFSEIQHPLIYYPKQLGEFWNHQLIRGGFVALMASEKRGKSYMLLDMATRAVRQKSKVAFFQAGDMTEAQQLRRFCIHLAKKSDKEMYCGEMYQPVRDCIYSQRGICEKEERENDFGIFEIKSEKEIRTEITLDDLKKAFEEYPEYSPCYNCKEYEQNHWGVPWIEKVVVKKPLDFKEANRHFFNYFIKKKRQLMLSTHPNNTLSVNRIKNKVKLWKKQYDFTPDIIIIDYADLLVSDNSKSEFRHQQNDIWKSLRNLSQELNCLVITVTQADANSYEKDLLSLKNFSEDKRKYAHVTAMYGLNQDHQGREKKIGIIRINELVVREGDFNNTNVVYVLQNLRRGQPCIGSFF